MNEPISPSEVALPQHAVMPEVAARAARMFHPGGYEITGYVLTNKISSWKAVVDQTGVRWMSLADMMRLMEWKTLTGSGAPPENGLDLPEAAAVPPPPVAKAALVTPASHEPLTDAEKAVSVLAERLGCVRNDEIPHNAGWFVPGNQVAYASPVDAIEALVKHLKQGGAVYQPVTDKAPSTPQSTRSQQHDRPSTQEALF